MLPTVQLSIPFYKLPNGGQGRKKEVFIVPLKEMKGTPQKLLVFGCMQGRWKVWKYGGEGISIVRLN